MGTLNKRIEAYGAKLINSEKVKNDGFWLMFELNTQFYIEFLLKSDKILERKAIYQFKSQKEAQSAWNTKEK